MLLTCDRTYIISIILALDGGSGDTVGVGVSFVDVVVVVVVVVADVDIVVVGSGSGQAYLPRNTNSYIKIGSRIRPGVHCRIFIFIMKSTRCGRIV